MIKSFLHLVCGHELNTAYNGGITALNIVGRSAVIQKLLYALTLAWFRCVQWAILSEIIKNSFL